MKDESSQAALADTVRCRLCGLLQQVPALASGQAAHCARCRHRLGYHAGAAQGRVLAFSLAALILYVPANIYPVLSMTYLGRYSENTIFTGVVELYRSGMWGIAALVFAASILVPLLKLVVMFYLLWVSRFGAAAAGARRRRCHSRLFRLVERIGPWSMLDVFLVAILVALVRLGDMADVAPEPGLVAFAAVVVLTMLASASFDATALWRDYGAREQDARDAREEAGHEGV